VRPFYVVFSFLICLSANAAQQSLTNLPNLMNPGISVDGLFSLTQFSRDVPQTFATGHDPRRNGFNLQQIEISYQSNVDPYFRADIHSVFGPDGMEFEEAYGSTTGLPGGFQIMAGQFFNRFGRGNPTHPHSWEFADKQLVLGRFFGGDGFRNPGLQISWLTPLPWFSEFIMSGHNSTGDTATSFRSPNMGDATTADFTTMRSISDLVYLLRTNNFVSLSEDLSLILGGSYLTGPNALGNRTNIMGADLYLRFRRPNSLAFITLEFEYLRRLYGGHVSTFDDQGLYTQVVFRLPEPWQRWHFGLRFDWVGPQTAPTFASGTAGADTDRNQRTRISPVISFYPTEFSKVRIQYDNDNQQTVGVQHVVSLQLEFLVGAHGAHSF
jgi:hypothetical protein